MSEHITRNDAKRMFRVIFQVGGSKLQRTLKPFEPVGFNEGMYGRNWDAYDIGDGFGILMGNRNTVGIEIPRELVEKMEEQASQNLHNSNTGDEAAEKNQQLLNYLKQKYNK